MKTFGAWLWEKQTSTDQCVRDFVPVVVKLGGDWPLSSSDKVDYENAVKTWADQASQASLLNNLDLLWAKYRRDVGNNRTARAPWATLMPLFGVMAVVAIIVTGLYFMYSVDFLEKVSKVEMARGLITFLFSSITVAIFLMIIIAVFVSDLETDMLAQRFQHGKDVLTLLIGVLGTIIGFYFGQATAPRGEPQKLAAAETVVPSAQASAASLQRVASPMSASPSAPLQPDASQRSPTQGGPPPVTQVRAGPVLGTGHRGQRAN